MTNPWYRMDQLLKCGQCSLKYRNPKLLPCNHTFCSEPCLEKLIDRSKQQLKCPECSAEHRVPHGGIQTFPNNVTLGRFLELRQQVSGREPELPPSMQRCNTCKEKGQLEMCAHCNRKVCKDCKTAHVNILRKEIVLINDQVRQGLKQLSGILHRTEEKADNLQKNYEQVREEIEEVVRRYTRDLYDTESKLKHDLDSYLKSELHTMNRLEHDLQVEMNNVNSNCDLVDKYVNNGVDWTDAELTDYKDIFLKTLDFLRTFDSDPLDCIRKVKFHPRADPDVVHKTLIDFAEVKLSDDINNNTLNLNNNIANDSINGGMHQSNGPSVTLTPPQLNAIARSQSDNRLAQQQKRQESNRNKNDEYDRETSYSRRRFIRDRDNCDTDMNIREDREYLGVSSWRRELDEVRSTQKNRFGSREYMDELDNSEKEPSPSRRGVRFEEKPVGGSGIGGSKARDHVAETEDATKGPLSGVIKILDSPHVMERLHHSEVRQKKLKEEEDRKAKQPPPPPPRVNRTVNRQLSEDEIEKQKKENKAAAAAAAATNSSLTSTTHRDKSTVSDSSRTRSRTSQERDSRPLNSRTISSYRSPSDSLNDEKKAKSPDETSISRRRTFEEEIAPVPTPRLRPWRTQTTTTSGTKKETVQSPPSSPTRGFRDSQKPPVSPKPKDSHPLVRPPSRSYLTKSSSLDHDDRPLESSPPLRRNLESIGRASSLEQKENSRPRLRLDMPPRPVTTVDTSESSSSESESSVDSDTATRRGDISPSVNTLLARSAQARRQSASTQARLLGRPDDDKKKTGSTSRSWRDTTRKDDDYKDGRGSPRRRLTSIAEPDDRSSPYSKLLADRRRSSLVSGSRFGREDSPEDRFRNDSSYSGSAARRNRIARSKSSHDLLPGDDSPDEDTISAIRNRYRTRKSRDKSPEEPSTNSWSQYLKNKYGTNRSSGSTTSNSLVRSRTSSVLAPRSGSDNSSDDDSTTRRRSDFRKRGDSGSPRGYSMPRRTYMAKGKPVLKIGSRGTEPGHFTWPRGVCVGPDNTIVVADSSNHRIQVFHSSGKLIQEFGSYGSNEGEFDCLAAVTVNRIGQFIVSDRYNHRVQVFDPSGRFVRSFGAEGRGEGKFSYPWGVATDNLGFIYVCDKENHRIQVFQGDGTYVTRFGSIGQRTGELEHPHYVAVSTTNRVIVSDSNNHRIQIFDVNGRLLSGFGTEGSEEGQFKYPRGVAVDDQGYLIVGDSGNNRIQVFHPDGTFLKAFGTWGSGDGEFKGLEGIAVSPSGQILVCDRENHRIQVF